MKFATPSRPEVRDEWVYISAAPICLIEVDTNKFTLNSIFVVPCIMLCSSEISPTRCNNCVFLFSAMALLYMFRATISPIIRSTYAVYGHR